MSTKTFEIYTLTICLPLYPKHDWERKIEISGDTSLHGLHLYIQKIIGFDNDHLYEFFAGRSHTNKKIEYSKISGNLHGSKYDNVLLKQVYPIVGLQLYYIFDFGDYWVFKIKKMRNKNAWKANTIYPRIVTSVGENPNQDHDWSH